MSFGRIFSCLAGHFIAHWEAKLGKQLAQDQLEPMTWATYKASLKRTGADYLTALEDCQRFSRKLADWYRNGRYDMVLSPTLSIPPTKLGAFHTTPDDPMSALKVTRAFVAFTYFCNITGQPAMSVPLFWNENGVPIGVQFAGRFGEEATLFRLAAQLEHARPWAGKIPPIHCSNYS